LDLGKSDQIWANLIRYKQNIASQKTFDLLRLWLVYLECIEARKTLVF